MKIFIFLYTVAAFLSAVASIPRNSAGSNTRHLINISERQNEKVRVNGPTDNAGRRKRSLDFDLHELQKDATPAKCRICAGGVNLIQYYIQRKGKTEDEIVEVLTELCIGVRYRPPNICKELFHTIGPEIVDILRTVTLGAEDVCSFVFNIACGNGDVPKHRWKVPLPDVKKPPHSRKEPPRDETPKMRVLHISDTHYDPLYHIGSKDVCDLPMCCRKENGMALKNESAAGTWGGWKCDIPERTLDNLLQQIRGTRGKFDYIIWTGDIPPHSSWSQTKEESLFLLNSTVEKILSYFPDTAIFPAVGNHEPAPPHNFPSPAIGRRETIDWFYNALAANWGKFLPNSTLSTIRKAGYYVARARPGLKIISLNTNFCYYNNWWLIINSTDPADQLQWFANELQTAETNGEKVHVIAHVPPGYQDCLKIWSQNYYTIISRYEDTVTAQFFGHTHTDEIEIFYDTENVKRAVSIGYVAPAVTTHIFLNPGYRIYSIDGQHNESNWYVADFETWVMNLTDANTNGTPHWYKMFTAKNAYGLKSLLPEDWNLFYEKLKTDDALLDTYDRHYWKDSPKRPPCDAECRKTRLCDIRSCVHYGPPFIKSTVSNDI